MREQLDEALRGAFPASAELASLEYVSVEDIDPDTFGIVMRLIIWEASGPDKVSIRDVKEQRIALRLDEFDRAAFGRVVEMFHALVDVASRALAHPDMEMLMPHDICDFSALKLSRAHTKDDFIRALCKPSRLGKYLPENQRS